MAMFTKLGRYTDTALLFMRVGIGAMMIMHGYPKLLAGPEKWTKLGHNMEHLGVKVYPEIWGFLASASESIGGLLIVLGFIFRPSAFFIMFTMIIATMSHFYKGEGIMDASESIELAFVFLGLFIMGPGRYSIDKS
jgi:putative oxidoreductase